jgi:hypothetical protein
MTVQVHGVVLRGVVDDVQVDDLTFVDVDWRDAGRRLAIDGVDELRLFWRSRAAAAKR